MKSATLRLNNAEIDALLDRLMDLGGTTELTPTEVKLAVKLSQLKAQIQRGQAR